MFRWVLIVSIASSCCAALAAAQTAAGSRGASQPAASQPTSRPATKPDDELAAIERALAADHRRAAEQRQQDAGGLSGRVARAVQSLNPDISLIADVALAYFSEAEPLMGGAHDPRATGFTLQQLELSASAAVDPYFRFDANLLFSQVGVEIEEVYGTTLALPWNLQLRGGQFLSRFGRYNAMHPHRWAFVDQVLVLGKFFGGDGHRMLGGELSVLLPLPWYVEISAAMANAAGEATARSFYGGEDLGVHDLGDFQHAIAVKQFFALGDDLSLSWGLSGAFGPNPTGRDNRTDIYGTDLYLKYRPISRGSYTIISLEVEWLLRRRQVPDDLLQDHGLCAALFWRFARRWAAAARYEYVTGASDDPLDPEWTGLRQRIAANGTFWATEFSRLRLQYSYDRPDWRAASHAVILALELAVGAHGAHKF